MRRTDWEKRLAAWLAAVEQRPYQWGSHDCALFGCGALEALTGGDYGQPWRGKYRSEAGAAKMLRRAGFDDHDAAFTAALGQPVPPLRLRRGDIISDGERIGLLWWAGAPIALFVGRDGEREGLVTFPATVIVRGWRV